MTIGNPNNAGFGHNAGSWQGMAAQGMAAPGMGAQSMASGHDPVEAYFECITSCSLDDGECITTCTTILREHH
jgi:hypothetical protein